MAAEVEWWSSGEEEAWVQVERKLVEDLKKIYIQCRRIRQSLRFVEK
jgi:hypothetical protein